MSQPAAVSAGDVEKYLYENIPIAKIMGIRVVRADDSGILMCAPFEPNVNHRGTVFGGSAGTLAILSAWAVVYRRMKQQNLEGSIVIQRNRVDYDKPMIGDFSAVCNSPAPELWERFEASLRRWNKARVVLKAELWCNDKVTGQFEGKYVALQ